MKHFINPMKKISKTLTKTRAIKFKHGFFRPFVVFFKSFSFKKIEKFLLFKTIVVFSIILAILFYWWLGLSGVIIIFCLSIALIIYTSYQKDVAIPVIAKMLEKHYYRIRKKINKKPINKLSVLMVAWLKVIYYAILLVQDSHKGLEIIIDPKSPLGLSFYQKLPQPKKISLKGKISKKTFEKYLSEFLKVHKAKKRKAAFYSLLGLSSTVLVVSFIGLISSFIFPAVNTGKAATYTFIQTSWQASTTATASHSNNRTGLTNFYSASGIATGTTITLFRASE